MEIIHVTSRKRETYNVQLAYSPLWECALGIAAITNTPLINTLEKPLIYWEELKEALSSNLLNHLEYVEKNNTWKAILQLLHYKEISSLKNFISIVKSLDSTELKFICLPFIGDKHDDLRKNAALGETSAICELKKLTDENSFFPQYIEFIVKTNIDELKTHIIEVMTEWYEAVIIPNLEQTVQILQTDYESKKEAQENMSPEELVQWATGGINYLSEPSVHTVLLIPQYVYRPWNIEADIEGTKVFYYPVSNNSLSPGDRYMPSDFLVQKHKALGDEVRLRMVKLLSENDYSLQSITERLNMSKTTVHHHLKTLRAAKIVEMNNLKYSLKTNSLKLLCSELEQYIKQ